MYPFQATVQNEDGDAIFNPIVTVYEEDKVTLASLFNEAGASLPNPITGTLEGFVQFWLLEGKYFIRGANAGDLTALWAFQAGPVDGVNIFQSRPDILSRSAGLKNGNTVSVLNGINYLIVPAGDNRRHFTVPATGQGLLALGGILLVGAGQSNMASSNIAAEGGDLTVNPLIKVWTDSGWQVFDPANGVGLWGNATNRNNIIFQAAKQAIRDGVPCVYCVIDAHPGNTIDQWIANANTGTTGPNWASLTSAVIAAVSAPESISAGVTQARGFIWGQGENNGGSDFDFDDYVARFDWLKVRLRGQGWFPAATTITALSMPPQPSSRVMDRVFKSYIPYDGDPFTSFTDTSDQPAPEGNLMHWTGVAMNEIGKRAWRQIQRGGISLQNPAIQRFPYARWHMEPAFGFGMGLNFVPGAEETDNRFVLGSVSNASGAGIAQNFIAWWRTRSLMQCLQHTWFEGGMTLKSYTLASFGQAGHAVNTDPNRTDGTCYSVTNGGIAKWNSIAGNWSIFAPSSTVVPA